MNSDILKILLMFDGDYKFFSQEDYIKTNHWSDVDPTKRKGAWVADKYDKQGQVIVRGLGDGVCEGLAAAYIISGRNWSNFKSYIASENGKSVVRGLVNLQSMNFQIPAANRIKPSDVRGDVLRSNRVTYLCKRVLPGNIMYENGGGDVFNNVGASFCYIVAMFGSSGAHALSMRFNDGRIRFFDPNFGEFSFPYINKQSKGMNMLIGYFLNYYYPKMYTRFLIEEYMVANN